MLKKLLSFSGRRAVGAPPGAEIQIFQISKILKNLKNCFNKYITWKSDQEEFQIMMFCISEWTHIIHNIISEFKISSLVGRFRAAWRAGRRGFWSRSRIEIVKSSKRSSYRLVDHFHDHICFQKSSLLSQDKSRSNGKLRTSILLQHPGQAWHTHISKIQLNIDFAYICVSSLTRMLQKYGCPKLTVGSGLVLG